MAILRTLYLTEISIKIGQSFPMVPMNFHIRWQTASFRSIEGGQPPCHPGPVKQASMVDNCNVGAVVLSGFSSFDLCWDTVLQRVMTRKDNKPGRARMVGYIISYPWPYNFRLCSAMSHLFSLIAWPAMRLTREQVWYTLSFSSMSMAYLVDNYQVRICQKQYPACTSAAWPICHIWDNRASSWHTVTCNHSHYQKTKSARVVLLPDMGCLHLHKSKNSWSAKERLDGELSMPCSIAIGIPPTFLPNHGIAS